jgi:large subunit ribosomal protein L1
MKSANFDQSVELHLNVDQVGLKGEVNLPHPVGKSVRVAVADEKVLADIEKGKLEFDVLITHPSFMSRLVRFAKILGPKGLMPNPKAGTISEKPEEVVKKFSRGVLRWKTEPKFPLVHQMIGKISFEEKALVENTERFLDSVGQAHITSAFIKTTMSPSIKLDLRL